MVRKKQVLMEMSAAPAFSACGRSSHMRPYKLLTGSVRVRVSSKVKKLLIAPRWSLTATRIGSFPCQEDSIYEEVDRDDSQEVHADDT